MVEGWNDGYPDSNWFTAFQQILQVIHDKSIGRSGRLLVTKRIIMLKVKQKETGIRKNKIKESWLHLPAGINCRMQAFVLTGPENGGQEFRLQQGLSARKSHPASRFVKKYPVAQNNVQYLINGIALTDLFSMLKPFVINHNLLSEYKRFGMDAFRIVTPLAGQRTPFEKDRRTDAGTVMYSKTLNIKNDSFQMVINIKKQ